MTLVHGVLNSVPTHRQQSWMNARSNAKFVEGGVRTNPDNGGVKASHHRGSR